MADTSHDVLCIGILVADIVVPPLERIPASGELILVDNILLSTGGCASNAAIDLAKLGVKVAVVGKTGKDIFAEFLSRDLQSYGVDISGLRSDPVAPTSRTVILPIIGSDRRYIHTLGANASLTVKDIDLGQVARSRVLYVGGYLLIPGFKQEALVELFQFARQHDIKTVLDVAGAPQRGLEPFSQVLPFTDVFLPNNDEAYAITGETDPFEQARTFSDCGAETTIITLGGNGVVARSQGRYYQAPAFPIDFVDASGGGDAFDAGYISGMLAGWDLARRLEFASAIGASACTRLGTTAGVFTRAEADTFLEQNHLQINTI